MPKNNSRVLVRAPSNIAIVKYMGKTDASRNLPANASLSMTLSKLSTYVDLVESGGAETRLVAGAPEGVPGDSPKLSVEGARKFMAHFERCREAAPALLATAGIAFRERGSADIRSANTFPQAAGIASSASSFAALTLATLAYYSADLPGLRKRVTSPDSDAARFREAMARISRVGSGSSCRSFTGPFVAWEREDVAPVASALPPLSDLVVVVAGAPKEVGSSEAHRRVLTSPHWPGRVERAEDRYRRLRSVIASGDFAEFAAIAAADSKDMHELFETSEPSFSYRTAATREVLEFLGQVGSPYAATLDAGPNVHVIIPQASEAFWRQKLVERFPQHPLLVDREGTGAEILFAESMDDAGAES